MKTYQSLPFLPAFVQSFPKAFWRHWVAILDQSTANERLSRQFNPNVAQRDVLNVRHVFDSGQNFVRTAHMMPFRAHNGHNVATLSEGKKKKTGKRKFLLDIVATLGHSVAMRKKQPFQASPGTDAFEAKRHRVYGPEDVIAAIDAIAELNTIDRRGPRSRSEIMMDLAKPYIRENQERLRSAGKPLPSFLKKPKR